MLTFLRFVVVALLGTSFFGAHAAPLPSGISAVRSVEGIDEYRLANGLQVLLVPDDSKPTTTVNITYRVGSRHENQGETGMAHLLEHLLFKGSPKHPAVWAEFQKRGLMANGTTSYDRTNYHAKFSVNNDNLRWYLGWLADAMVNSYVARKDLDTEMTVVRNEMEMGENSPARVLRQRALAAMFDWHPYGKSTIGARSDVENVEINRLQAFYRTYYQPDNATLIVAGKFEVARVLSWVVKSFGAIPAPKRTLPALYTLDPAQDGPRSVSLRRAGGTPLVYASYHMPAAATPEFAAAELLEIILGDSPTGRLHKRLTQRQLAARTSAQAWGLADPGVFFVSAELTPNQALDAAQTELLAVTEKIVSEPLTEAELQRAKLKWLTQWEESFSDPEDLGILLSEYVAQGDWRLYFLQRDRIHTLTLADVQRVAEQYMVPDNRTLATFIPTDKPARAPAPAKANVAQALQNFQPKPAEAIAEAFEATPANIDARTQTFTVAGLQAAVLPKSTRGGAVQAWLTLHYGNETTLRGQTEVANAVAQLLDKGTATLSREQVRDRLDALKTQLAVTSGPGGVTVSLSSRGKHLPDAIALVGELLRRPLFAPEALAEHQQQWLTLIAQQSSEPNAVAKKAVARLGNPYPRGDVRHARSFDEMAQDVRDLNTDQLRAFHNRFYSASKGEFSAVGEINVPAVRAALEAAFAQWINHEPYTRVPQPWVAVPPERLILNTPDKQNAYFMARLPLPLSDTHPDYPAFMVANLILGDGGSSRLWSRIRENDGLSYGVGSSVQWSSLDSHSPWQTGAIYAPQNREKLETAFKEEIARALKDGFTQQELREAQSGLLSARRLARAQDTSLVASLANNLYLGRTFAVSAQVDVAIENLTLEQVNAALRKYLTPEQFVLAFAGDFKSP